MEKNLPRGGNLSIEKNSSIEKVPEDAIGVIVSPTKIDEFSFILLPDKEINKREYCFIRHPLERGSCLARVVDGTRINPEVLPTAITALLIRLGFTISADREIVQFRAETLSYLGEDGFLHEMDFPPAPGSYVYAAKSVEPFLKSTEGILIPAGTDPHSNLELKLSLDLLTNGHVIVSGMTRSGKSTFMLTFVTIAASKGMKFLIFDKAGEYIEPLRRAGLKMVVLDPSEFESLASLDKDAIASALGLKGKGKSTEIFLSVIRRMIGDGEKESIIQKELVLNECQPLISRDKERILAEINNLYEERAPRLRKLSTMREEPIDVIEPLRENQVVIVDFSRVRSIEDLQLTSRNLLRRIFNFATATRGEELTFSVIIEEAQFIAPEHYISYGDPERTKSRGALLSCLSQLGGYNVGFIVMTQRPAYVSKSVLSQGNTFLAFRMKSPADHEQVAGVTGYPTWRIASLLSGLDDHVTYLIGMASPFGFPTFIQTPVSGRIYPHKATKTPSQIIIERGEVPS